MNKIVILAFAAFFFLSCADGKPETNSVKANVFKVGDEVIAAEDPEEGFLFCKVLQIDGSTLTLETKTKFNREGVAGYAEPIRFTAEESKVILDKKNQNVPVQPGDLVLVENGESSDLMLIRRDVNNVNTNLQSASVIRLENGKPVVKVQFGYDRRKTEDRTLDKWWLFRRAGESTVAR